MMLSSVFKAARHQRVRIDASLPLFSAANSFFSSDASGPVVRFKDVSFAHPGSPNELLENADFSITKGSKVVSAKSSFYLYTFNLLSTRAHTFRFFLLLQTIMGQNGKF
jgi:hypothetical protein